MRAAAGGIGCSCRGFRSELICVRTSSAALQVLIIFSRSSMSSRSILSRNWLSFIPNTTQSRIRLSVDAGRSQCRAFDRRSVMNSSNEWFTCSLSTREQSVSLHCYVLLWYTVCFELFLQLFQFLSVFFSVEREGVAYLVSSASNEMEECCRWHRVVFVDEACGRGVDVESLLKTFPFGSFVAGENIQFFGLLKSDGSHASDTMWKAVYFIEEWIKLKKLKLL